MKKHRILRTTLILIFLNGSSSLMRAQTANTGALSGRITDPSGAVVPTVEVKLTNQSTGEQRTVTTGPEGLYKAPLLPPGNYQVTITATGFKTATYPAVVVRVTETNEFNVVLEVGTATEQVTVEAAASLVTTEKAALGRVVDNASIVSLPLVTRNFQHIMTLSPGVLANVPDATALGRNPIDVFAHGARATDNSFQMDGIQVNNFHTNRPSGVPVPAPDAIEEFKVQTGQFDAGYGRQPGANVSIVTKSGGTQFHGSLFEFFRNEDLNATPFFVNLVGGKKPVLRQNQFGGTLGGPLIKNKLHFFVSYQGTRQINGLSSTSLRSLVFPKGFGPDRSRAALGAAFCGQAGFFGGTTVACDGSNINPVALAILNAKLPDGSLLVPNPQVVQPAGTGFSTYSIPATFNENQLVTNLDFLQSSKSKLTGKFFYANSPTFESLTAPVPGWARQTTDLYANFALTHIYTITPHLINEARLGVDRQNNAPTGLSPISATSVGIPLANSDWPQFPNISVSGTFSIGPATTSYTKQMTYNAGDSLSWVKDKHFLRFGFDLSHVQDNFDLRQLRQGTITFNSFPDFLLGLNAAQNGTAFSNLASSQYLTGITDRALRVTDWSLFVQDDWKVYPRLTLNVGLRVERIAFPTEAHGKLVNLWPDLANPNPTGTDLSGFVAPENFVSHYGQPPAGVKVLDNTCALENCVHNAWGPRFGFAFQPLPNTNRVVLRGGYGIFYTRLHGNNQLQLITDMPFIGQFRVFGAANSNATFQNPWFPAPPSSAYPVWLPRSPTSSISLENISPDFQPPIIQQWSFNTQLEFVKGYLLEVGYVGSKGNHIFGFRWPNQPYIATPSNPVRGQTTSTIANLGLRTPWLGFAPTGIAEVHSSGRFFSNELNVNLTKRLTKHFQLLASYTWTKTLDDTDQAGSSATFGGWWSNDQRNERQAYGPSEFLRPQRLIISYLYTLPEPSKSMPAAHALLGGWQLSGVTTFQSGNMLTVYDSARSGSIYGWPQFTSGRAQLAPGVTSADLVTAGTVTSKLNNYFNKASFANPPVIGDGFDWGNSARGITTGPDQRNFDIGLSKTTHLKGTPENSRLGFRAEFFNAFNTSQFANPVTDRSSATFARITATAVGPRVIQFALKYNF